VEFYRLEPWGFEIEESRLGRLCALVAGVAGAQGVSPLDFMLTDKPDPKAQEQLEADELREKLQRLFRPRPVIEPTGSQAAPSTASARL